MTLALFCLMVTLTLAPQAQSRDGRPDTSGTAVIRGRVVVADTGAALRDATVTLVWVTTEADASRDARPTNTATPPTSRNAATDAGGRFEFAQLPPGTYRVLATAGTYRSRYLPRGFGATRSHEAGQTIQLKAGEVKDADIALGVGSAIEGRVVDDSGEPISRVSVFAARLVLGSGAPQRAPVTAGESDDLGRYRIYGLEEGTYIVAAEGRGIGGPAIEGPSEGFTTTYHPSGASEIGAQKVRVPAAQDVVGIDIQIVRTRRCRIAGLIMDSQGRPFGRANATLMRPTLTGYTSTIVSVDAEGRFAARDLDPGDYRLAVRSGSVWNSSTVRRGEFAELPLNVTGDIDDLLVITQPGATVSGRIVFTDGVLPAKAALRIGVHSVQPFTLSSTLETTANVDSDMRFVVSEMFGPKLLRMISLPQGWAVKAVMLGQMDITDTPTDLGRQSGTHVEILLTTRTSTVEGVVTDDRGTPASDAVIYVFPEDRLSWKRSSPRVVVADVGDGGRFAVRGLSGGHYFAVAVAREGFRPPSGAGEEFFSVLRTDATPFVIGDDERRVVDLRLWRWPE